MPKQPLRSDARRRLAALVGTGMLAVTVAACGTTGGKQHDARPVVEPTPFIPGQAGPPAAETLPAPATTAPAPESPAPSAEPSETGSPTGGPPATAPSTGGSSRTPADGPSTPGKRPGTATPPADTAQPAAIPAPRVPMNIVRDTGETGRTVALTFDDGPDPHWTPQVLDLLRAHHVKATFCMVGPNAEAHPALVKRVLAEGHRLCDHSVTHDVELDRRDVARITGEIVPAQDQIITAAGGSASVKWFRAPGGAWSPTVRAVSAAYGMKPLGWSVDTRDWEKPGVDTILENVRRELRPGGVILMHDAGGDRSQTVEALRRLLPWLDEQGYRVTFPA